MANKAIFTYHKVMVIDDTAIDRLIAEKMIRHFSLAEEVVNMESAQDALVYLNATENLNELPQLIFLDINMPGMNGFEFLEAYGRLPEAVRKNCIVMMLTTSLNEEDMTKAEASPFVRRFLNKPLNGQKINELKNAARE